MNLLYLVNKSYVQKKMSRIRFHSIEALSKIINITITGIGFPYYDDNKTVSENINFIEKLNKKKFNVVIAYKPLEYKNFKELDILKIIRYNEMYDKNLTIQEITESIPDIVICHHQNDYLEYEALYNKNQEKFNNLRISFYHIPHCINLNIFKNYNLPRKYDIAFSGALGNSILGNHYPIRQKLLETATEFVKKYPQFNLYIHPHPGYNLDDAFTNKYAVELSKIYNQSYICLTCSGAPNTRFAKYIEIPGSNSVLMGDIPNEKDDKDSFKEFIIEVKKEDTKEEIIDKLYYYLSDKKRLIEKRKQGYIWSQKYNQTYYANKLNYIIKQNLNEMYDNTIQCLWIGKPLGKIEIASLKSFVKNGHIVHLYLYDKNLIDLIDLTDLENKDLVFLKDANEILLEKEIFLYENGSCAAFSNLFRFKLLYMKGGYWADLDLINVKLIDFKEDYVFVSEPTPDYKSQVPTTCLIKMPKHSLEAKKALELCYKYKDDVINNRLKWGLGPKILNIIIENYNLQNYVKTWTTVCSCHPNDTASLFNVNYKNNRQNNLIINKLDDIPREMYCVHLWNKVISEYSLLKYLNKECFLSKLLEKR